MTDVRDFRREETLRNGMAVTIRALRPDDREKVAAAVRALDAQTIYTRLFTYRKDLAEKGLDRIMSFDPDNEVVLVVTMGSGGDEIVIGGGRYVSSGKPGTPRSAEVAFTVEEDYQGLGIAGRLLAHLVDIAREKRIVEFEAEVLAENASMLKVFARCGLPMRRRMEAGILHISMALEPEARS